MRGHHRSVTAVVPVKQHSSRLPGKNLLPFAGKSLLGHKIAQLKATPEVSRIIVSSDSREMLEIAIEMECDVDERPGQFADESRPFPEFIDYIATKVSTEDMLWACVTSPMVGPKLYSQAICQFPELISRGYDSVVSVYPVRQYLFDSKGPIGFGTKSTHKNSQDMPLAHLYTAGLILAPITHVEKWSFIFGPKPFLLEIPQANSVDIDTYEDYISAKAFFQEFGADL